MLLFVGQACVETCQTPRDGGCKVGLGVAEADHFHEVLEACGGLALTGKGRLDEIGVGHAYGVHDDEAVLVLGVCR